MGNIEFYVIYSWMRDELHLSGTELDCYAVIYCLSQSDNRYIAGVKRLMELLHKSEPSIISALKKLTEKGLLEKDEVVINNVKRHFYKALIPTKEILGTTLNNLSDHLKKFKVPTLKNLSGINNINNINKKETNKTCSNEQAKSDDDFTLYMRQHYPYIMKMDKPLTQAQATKLKDEYGEEIVLKVFEAMDNYKQLLKKYRDAYKTAENWCKREMPAPKPQPQQKED